MCLLANLCSFALDYCARQKIGHSSHISLHESAAGIAAFRLWPIRTLDASVELREWISHRVAGLLCTTYYLTSAFGGHACSKGQFVWDDERRFLIRCELDAAFFHLYGLARDDVEYILDTFPIVKEHDEEAYGEFRTKRAILEVYDAMADPMATTNNHETSTALDGETARKWPT